MAVDWNSELSDQLAFYWDHLFWPRMRGLTDEEYFWEPVDGCWTIRRSAEGAFQCDWAFPEPDPPPVTTIAWRLAHLATGVLGMRAAQHFGDGPGVDWFTDGQFDFTKVPWPGDAASGLALVEQTYTAWRNGVRALGDGGMGEPCGPAEGPYAQRPKAALVLHINREVFHHGAEVSLLRDLFRASEAASERLSSATPPNRVTGSE